MIARSVLLWGLALVTAPLAPACAPASPAASSPAESTDGAAPDGTSGGGSSSGSSSSGSSSSGGSSSGGASGSGSSSGDAAAGNDEDSGSSREDSGRADASHARDSGECVRPPYQTTNECTGIGTPNGPKIPSCSRFDGSGNLICPTIPGCTVVPDPTGSYCMGDNVQCGLSDCGHICLLPNWEPCYDVASGDCLEGC